MNTPWASSFALALTGADGAGVVVAGGAGVVIVPGVVVVLESAAATAGSTSASAHTTEIRFADRRIKSK
jgi:hypothetical protein